MGFTGFSRLLSSPASLGLVLAGFIAGVAVQLQQAMLWRWEAYAATVALAVALAVCFFGINSLHAFKSRALRLGLVIAAAALLLGFGVTGSFLSMAYFDLPYNVMGITAISLHLIAARAKPAPLQQPAAAEKVVGRGPPPRGKPGRLAK